MEEKTVFVNVQYYEQGNVSFRAQRAEYNRKGAILGTTRDDPWRFFRPALYGGRLVVGETTAPKIPVLIEKKENSYQQSLAHSYQDNQLPTMLARLSYATNMLSDE